MHKRRGCFLREPSVRVLPFSGEPGSVRSVEVVGRADESIQQQVSLRRGAHEIGAPDAPRRAGVIFEDPGNTTRSAKKEKRCEMQ